MAKKIPYVQNPHQLQQRFYEFLDTDHILTKTHALCYAIQNATSIHSNELDGLSNVEPDNEGQYKMRLINEIYFSVYQQFEFLYALMLAKFQSHPHWLFVKSYSNKQFDNWMTLYLKGEIEQMIEDIAGEKISPTIASSSDFINYALYEGHNMKEVDKGVWEEHLLVIDKFLRHLCKMYQKRDVYNSFKHGLRFSSKAVQMRIDDSLLLSAPNAIVYFTSKNDKVHQVVKGVSLEASLYLIEYMCLLLRTIKMFRLSSVDKKETTEKLKFTVFKNENWEILKEKLKKEGIPEISYGPI